MNILFFLYMITNIPFFLYMMTLTLEQKSNSYSMKKGIVAGNKQGKKRNWGTASGMELSVLLHFCLHFGYSKLK